MFVCGKQIVRSALANAAADKSAGKNAVKFLRKSARSAGNPFSGENFTVQPLHPETTELHPLWDE